MSASLNVEHIGTTGAKRQTGLSTNPRAALRQIVVNNPSASENEVFDLCWSSFVKLEKFNEAVATGYFKTMFEYWFANNYRSVMTGVRDPIAVTAKMADTKARIVRAETILSAGITSAIERKAKVMLLDMTLPNGKKLRDCTKQECSAISTNSGAFLMAVSRVVPKGKTVGQSLSENQLQDIYDSVSR